MNNDEMSIELGKKEKVIVKKGYKVNLFKSFSSHSPGFCGIQVINKDTGKTFTNPVPFYFLIELECKMYREYIKEDTYNSHKVVYDNKDPESNTIYNSVKVDFCRNSLCSKRFYVLELSSEDGYKVRVKIKHKEIEPFLCFLQKFIENNYTCEA